MLVESLHSLPISVLIGMDAKSDSMQMHEFDPLSASEMP